MDSVAWTREIDEMIREAVARYGSNDWSKVCQKLRGQQITPEQCQMRWETVLRDQTVKGPWSEEEDAILRSLVEKFGPKKWSTIASYINGRIGKQCRERWLNHLNPDVSKEAWTEQEDEILINAQIQMGNKWSYISKLLPGRSENAVKNRYNSIASRNGVRKKRLGNYVTRTQSGRGNPLRTHVPPKAQSASANRSSLHLGSDVLDKASPYAGLLSMASQQATTRTIQRQQQRQQQQQQQQQQHHHSHHPHHSLHISTASPTRDSVQTYPSSQSLSQSDSYTPLPAPYPVKGMHMEAARPGRDSLDIGLSHYESNAMSAAVTGLDEGEDLFLNEMLPLPRELGGHEDNPHSLFNFPLHSPGGNFSLSPATAFPFQSEDTSEMTLPATMFFPKDTTDRLRSMQDEETALQQIDSFLLSGNTIMGAQATDVAGLPPLPADLPFGEDLAYTPPIRSSYIAASEPFFPQLDEVGSPTLQPASSRVALPPTTTPATTPAMTEPTPTIPSAEGSVHLGPGEVVLPEGGHVHFRQEAATPSLNYGVYASWERETGREGDAMSDLSPAHAAGYQSLDLLDLLHEPDSFHDGSSLVRGDSRFLMQDHSMGEYGGQLMSAIEQECIFRE